MPKPIAIEEPGSQDSAHPARFALWALGFRPFYLVASVFAALSIPLWVAQYAGWISVPHFRGATVHGHEMLFGYTLAVISGFLFTAGRTWTGQPTPTGGLLIAFVALWVAGRVLVYTPWQTAAAAVNAAFPLAVAGAFAAPLAKSRNRRNYFFVPLLLGFAAAAVALHLSYRGVLAWPELLSLRAGLDLVLFIIAVMGGRVIPMFTNNAIPGAQATRRPAVEKLALGTILVLLVVDLVQAPPPLIAAVALAAALAHAVRLGLWRSWRTFGTPLVWVLHAAYGWIVVHLMLRAFAALDIVAEPLAVHALTIGAIGGMTIGMITRTARGHTGRPLVADRFEIACFVLIQAAALIRVVGGGFVPIAYQAAVVASGICWSIAFTVYAVRYWPILSRPRIDGKPG